MTQPLTVRASWDEVAGTFTGHIEGLPEITLDGAATPEDFEQVVEAAVERLKLTHHKDVVIHYGPRPATLDIAA